MVSPDTGGPLVPLTVDGVTVQICKQTGGIWFPEDAIADFKRADPPGLEKLDQQTVPPIAPQPAESSQVLACPADGSSLMRYHFASNYDVILYQCLQCGGIWAAHTELDKMISVHETMDNQPALKQLNYPKDNLNDYDDNAPTPEPANLAPEAKAAVAEMGLETAQHFARCRAFQRGFAEMSRYFFDFGHISIN